MCLQFLSIRNSSDLNPPDHIINPDYIFLIHFCEIKWIWYHLNPILVANSHRLCLEFIFAQEGNVPMTMRTRTNPKRGHQLRAMILRYPLFCQPFDWDRRIGKQQQYKGVRGPYKVSIDCKLSQYRVQTAGGDPFCGSQIHRSDDLLSILGIIVPDNYTEQWHALTLPLCCCRLCAIKDQRTKEKRLDSYR